MDQHVSVDVDARVYRVTIPSPHGASPVTTAILLVPDPVRGTGHIALLKDGPTWRESSREANVTIASFLDLVVSNHKERLIVRERRTPGGRKREAQLNLATDSAVLAVVRHRQPCRRAVIAAGVPWCDFYAINRSLQRLRKAGDITYRSDGWSVAAPVKAIHEHR
jgi:hypothetical protein